MNFTEYILDKLMEFDHMIQVHPNGSVTVPKDIYAPSLYDDELDDKSWGFFTTGYSGQYNYSGPIMHNSEYIGGRLARDILDTPGYYVAVVSYYSPEHWAECLGISVAEAEDADRVEGWAVAYRESA